MAEDLDDTTVVVRETRYGIRITRTDGSTVDTWSGSGPVAEEVAQAAVRLHAKNGSGKAEVIEQVWIGFEPRVVPTRAADETEAGA